MKVTLVNHSDTLGGASVVTFRLMEALRAEGVDARMLVAKKNSASPFVEEYEPRLLTRISFLKEHARIYLHNGFSRKTLFQISLASDGLPLSRHPLIIDSDAVILNWINQGMLSLKEISKIARMKPTLWTMHDQWNFTGVCHHTSDCENFLTHCKDCPYLGSMASARDISWQIFNKKSSLYDSCDITFIAVSEWLAKRAKQSTLLGDKEVITIPNAFPVAAYAAPAKYSKTQLGLPDDKKIILFCAARIDDPGKGLPDAIKLLNQLPERLRDECVAVFVGACRDEHALDDLLMNHVCLGLISDSEKIRSLMKHSSVVLSTSPFETLSTTMIEAQAAGATPVCYIHDGRGDIVTDNVNGYALTNSTDALPLIKALENPITSRQLAEAACRYDASVIARRYISVITDKI